MRHILVFLTLLLSNSFLFAQNKSDKDLPTPEELVKKEVLIKKYLDEEFHREAIEKQNIIKQAELDSLNKIEEALKKAVSEENSHSKISESSTPNEPALISNDELQDKPNKEIIPSNSNTTPIAKPQKKETKIDILQPVNEKGSIGGGYNIFATGPEQNCSGAIEVCTQSYTQSASYTGFGTQEIGSGTCLGTKETNSVWYVFTVQSSGTFGFTLTTSKDYDFALYNITAGGCASIPTSVPVRCNYSASYGNTGMSSSGACTTCSAGDGRFATELAVTAGQTFALIINNFTADASGYSLSFNSGGSYASITDVIPPTLSSITANCNNTVTITTNEAVDCASIASNGSDFTITGGGSISSASGVGCATNALTNQIIVGYTISSSGTFTFGIKAGGDGNTILDKCGNAMSNTQTIATNLLHNFSLSAASSTFCTSGQAVTLTASGGPASVTNLYSLNPSGQTATSNGSGSASFTVNPVSTTTYVATATYNGCTKTASTTLSLIGNIITTVSPINPTICSGTTNLTATTTLNGVVTAATYQWSGASTATTQTISGGAGTYNVVGTISGCPSNTASSTISIINPATVNGCNIIYVSPSGGGTGLLKSSPTDLATAIGMSSCSNTIIKMQTGTYNFTNKLDIGSYITIEGGYNSTFTTKTSDMSSGGSTRLVRSATPDGGSGNSVTMFNVAAAATSFRLQDLRIEMPVHSSGTRLTNYGVYLGAGASSYKIVRCYIDAGQGSN
jgi:hypothetical protein